MKLIIDGDMIAYRAAFGSEHEIKWDDDVFTLHLNMHEALDRVDSIIEASLKKLGAKEYVTVFSDKKNFRHDLDPSYKANRKDRRKPLGLSTVIDQMFLFWNGMKINNLEADDVIGILCSKHKDHIAVSGDKDFHTIPGKFYNFLKDEMYDTTVDEANKFHLIQTLAGDTADGYPGVKGVGMKTAEKLLDKEGYTWDAVVKIYESKGMTEDAALVTARLAYILRHQDFNLKTKKMKSLWKPTTT
tara:strand:- start:9352 stop:10083 length:732 start_codon:yes stop_codon:yes gene_type:complete